MSEYTKNMCLLIFIILMVHIITIPLMYTSIIKNVQCHTLMSENNLMDGQMCRVLSKNVITRECSGVCMFSLCPNCYVPTWVIALRGSNEKTLIIYGEDSKTETAAIINMQQYNINVSYTCEVNWQNDKVYWKKYDVEYICASSILMAIFAFLSEICMVILGHTIYEAIKKAKCYKNNNSMTTNDDFNISISSHKHDESINSVRLCIRGYIPTIQEEESNI